MNRRKITEERWESHGKQDEVPQSFLTNVARSFFATTLSSSITRDSFYVEGFKQYEDDGLIPARIGREDRQRKHEQRN